MQIYKMVLILMVGMFVLIGCQKKVVLEKTQKAVTFGASYRIITDSYTPQISDLKVKVQVGYSGCSGNHPFKLEFRFVSAEVTEVWLIHDIKPEFCDAYFQEDLMINIPKIAFKQSAMVLVAPDGTKYALR